MKNIVVLLSLVVAFGLAMPAPAVGYDRTESDACKDCHFYPGDVVTSFVVNTWLDSDHADSYHGANGNINRNTYCAICHSPFQADPNATESVNDPVLEGDWEAVTCGACHPPQSLRNEWGTATGTYDVATGAWSAVYEEDTNDLCTHCHTGMGQIDFKSYGNLMVNKKGVQCIDCHMPKVPNTEDNSMDRRTRTHDLDVGLHLSYSCLATECHVNKTEEWAAKKIAKDKIHGKTK